MPFSICGVVIIYSNDYQNIWFLHLLKWDVTKNRNCFFIVLFSLSNIYFSGFHVLWQEYLSISHSQPTLRVLRRLATAFWKEKHQKLFSVNLGAAHSTSSDIIIISKSIKMMLDGDWFFIDYHFLGFHQNVHVFEKLLLD